MGRVSGRSCLVTGAARGIGRAAGEALLDDGADVCAAAINGVPVAEVAKIKKARAEAAGGRVTSATVDVAKRDQVR
jgi:meso-butanediol dehydrogenase/(S,S)-butanediol dehydrogenase/diacetyl reductase